MILRLEETTRVCA